MVRMEILSKVLWVCGLAVTLATSVQGIAQFDQAHPVVTDLDWSADGTTLAIARGYWQGELLTCVSGTEILLMNPSTEQTTLIDRSGEDVCSAAGISLNATGSLLALTYGFGYEVWDLGTTQQTYGVTQATSFGSALWSPVADELLVTSYVGMLINRPDRYDPLRGGVRDAAADRRYLYSDWSPNGQDAASITTNGDILVWNTLTGLTLSTFTGHTAPVKRLDWNPNREVVASGDDSGVVWLWDATTGAAIRPLTGHRGIVYDLAWSPDGTALVSAGADNTLRVWNPTTGAMRIVDSSRIITAVAYSPDGTQLAYGGSFIDPGDVDVQVISAPLIAPMATSHDPDGTVQRRPTHQTSSPTTAPNAAAA